MVWSTATEGFDYLYPSLLLTSHAITVLCEEELQEEEDISHLGAAALLHVQSHSRQKGCLLVPIPEYPYQIDSDKTDTDPEDLMLAETCARQPIPHAGQAILRKCPVCDVHLVLGMALFRHLHQVHPHDRPYHCKDCASSYNNLKELSSHRLNVHHVATVSCSCCDYMGISKAKMWQHVRCHTTGFMCQKCGKGFPTLTELSYHEHLYDTREMYKCDQCDSEYFMQASLKVHKTGKHGSGYCCQKCGLCFDTPSQQIQYKKLCGELS